MPTFGRIDLNAQEIGKIVAGEQVKLGLWDQIKDLFRSETKRGTIEFLLGQMKTPFQDGDAHVYLQNFERIAAHARPECLHEFSLSVEPTGSHEGTELKFAIGGHPVATQEVNADRHFDHLVSYAALYELRGQAANPKFAHRLCDHVNHEDITRLIVESCGAADGPRPPNSGHPLDGTRRRYGEFTRQLRQDMERKGQVRTRSAQSTNPFGEPPVPRASAKPVNQPPAPQASTNPFDPPPAGLKFAGPVKPPPASSGSTQPSDPTAAARNGPAPAAQEDLANLLAQQRSQPVESMVPPAAPSPVIRRSYQPLPSQIKLEGSALDVLDSIDEKVVKAAGARLTIRALPQPAPGTKIGPLLERDADFTRASIASLVKAGADFEGVSLRTLVSSGADVRGADLEQMQSRGVSIEGFSLAQLIYLGVKGRDTPVFVELDGRQCPALPLYSSENAAKLKLQALLGAGFSVADVSVKQLEKEFDLRECPFDTLQQAGVNLFGTTVAQLRGFGIDFGRVKLAGLPQGLLLDRGAQIGLDDLAGMGFDFAGSRATDLFDKGLQKAGCRLAALLDKGVSPQGLGLKDFIAAGGNCQGTDLSDLKARGVLFDGTSFEDLRAARIDMQGVQAADLVQWTNVKGTGVAALMAAKVDAGRISVNDLLREEVSFAGSKMTEVLGWHPDLNGCPLRRLLDDEADFNGVSVQRLASEQAGFENVTYAELRARGADFSGLTADAVSRLGKAGFFAGVSVAELLRENPDAAGWHLADLTRGGATLGEVSTRQLLDRGIRLDEVNAGGIDTSGASIKELLANKVSFAGASVVALLQQEAKLDGIFVRTLLDQQASFDGVSVKWLKDLGVSFAGVTFSELRGAGCNFSELSPQELRELRDRDFFRGASAAELLGAHDLDLRGWNLKDLPGTRQSLAGVSIAAAVRKGMSLAGLGLGELITRKADLSGAHVGHLQAAGLAFPTVEFELLVGEKMSFADMKPAQLNANIRFSRYSATDAVANGLTFGTIDDVKEFEKRGGLRAAAPSQGAAGRR